MDEAMCMYHNICRLGQWSTTGGVETSTAGDQAGMPISHPSIHPRSRYFSNLHTSIMHAGLSLGISIFQSSGEYTAPAICWWHLFLFEGISRSGASRFIYDGYLFRFFRSLFEPSQIDNRGNRITFGDACTDLWDFAHTSRLSAHTLSGNSTDCGTYAKCRVATRYGKDRCAFGGMACTTPFTRRAPAIAPVGLDGYPHILHGYRSHAWRGTMIDRAHYAAVFLARGEDLGD